MILKSVRIENFKCIEDSTEFSIDPVICLVGKNEAGKTALLQALYKLKPDIQEKSDFKHIIDYPRRKHADYKKRYETDPDNVLTTIWELNQADVDALEQELGKDSLKNTSVKITKGHDNILGCDIEIDEKRVIAHVLKSTEFDQEEFSNLQNLKSIEELKSKLESIDPRNDSQNKLLIKLNEDFPCEDASEPAIKILEERLPTFLYFSEYHKLPGRISINKIREKESANTLKFEDKIFLALLNLAGTSLDDIGSMAQFEPLKAELEAVSIHITDEIFEYWTQNKDLEVEFDYRQGLSSDEPPFNEGFIFHIRIKNRRHKVTVSFDERSAGFNWFFSFLVWFSQLKKNYGENLIILLDDPALTLHARAQADLLRYINEKLKPHYQVIYTTHSPFMIDPENILSVRTVEDVTKDEDILGTKVEGEVLSTDIDTLFPLQAALGYDITQTLFVGKNNLLVEGPSDILYLKWFSNVLKKQNRTFLNPQWTICPCEGISKICSFLALFSGAKLHIAIFTDFHEGTKRKVHELKESELLKSGHVFSADMFVDQNEADIEDLIGRPNFITLINKCYNLTGNRRLPAQKPSDASIRVLKEVEDKFGRISPKIPEFDHYEPALYLMEHTTEMLSAFPDLAQALDRFELFFKDLNKLLEE